jgi:hypothetical protein
MICDSLYLSPIPRVTKYRLFKLYYRIQEEGFEYYERLPEYFCYKEMYLCSRF